MMRVAFFHSHKINPSQCENDRCFATRHGDMCECLKCWIRASVLVLKGAMALSLNKSGNVFMILQWLTDYFARFIMMRRNFSFLGKA